MLETLTQEQALAKFQNLIYSEVHKFLAYKGGDWDELLSDAYIGFVTAYRSYQERGQRTNTGQWHFGGWAKFTIWKRLLDEHRRRCKKNSRINFETNLNSEEGDDFKVSEINDPDRFTIQKLARELSDDAKKVLDYIALLEHRAPTRKRSLVVRHLQELGWAGQRIVESFNEVREALGI